MTDKKKLKEMYKNMVPPKGIFSMKNTQTGRVFLGSSMNLKSKDVTTILLLKIGNHFNSDLQKDWNQYGEAAFLYEILETIELKDDPNYDYNQDLEILEMIWIDKFKPFSENCYNKNEKIRIV